MANRIKHSLSRFFIKKNEKTAKLFCNAPWSSMSFNIDGTVAVCCYNKKTTVSIVGKSIKEVWESITFEKLRDHVQNSDLTYDCQICLGKIQVESTTNLKARDFDKFEPSKWPQIMEFCLENVCNLACEMCNSTLSSTIRKNNDLPALKTKYSEEFLEELNEFIPHLKEAVFVGGEPFLIPSYFVIWDKMRELNPSISISIVTNGTVLNNRIKSILEKGNFNLNISIDSVDAITYETVRNNAKFETLMQNFFWFKAYCDRKNTTLNIPICPMTSNWKTIPETVRFANRNNVFINFCYVEKPINLSLIEAKTELLALIHQSYKAEKFENNTHIAQQNIDKFQNLMNDIEKWKDESNNITIDIEIWRKKILFDATNKDISGLNEIIDLIEEHVRSLTPDQQKYVLKMINEHSTDRIYEICHTKSQKEINLIIDDLLGLSTKIK